MKGGTTRRVAFLMRPSKMGCGAVASLRSARGRFPPAYFEKVKPGALRAALICANLAGIIFERGITFIVCSQRPCANPA